MILLKPIATPIRTVDYRSNFLDRLEHHIYTHDWQIACYTVSSMEADGNKHAVSAIALHDGVKD